MSSISGINDWNTIVSLKPIPTLLQEYPSFMWVKGGVIFNVEAVFNQIGFKYGIFETSTGTVTQDTSHVYGGSGSAKLVTAATANDSSELKYVIQNLLSGKVAFEFKWTIAPAFGGSKVNFGIENRVGTNRYQSQVQWTKNNGKYQYESNSPTQGQFVDFNPIAKINAPIVSSGATGGGDVWQWGRIVIDLNLNRWVEFDFTDANQYLIQVLLDSPLGNYPPTNQPSTIEFFASVQTAAGGVETLYTTDWVISTMQYNAGFIS